MDGETFSLKEDCLHDWNNCLNFRLEFHFYGDVERAHSMTLVRRTHVAALASLKAAASADAAFLSWHESPVTCDWSGRPRYYQSKGTGTHLFCLEWGCRWTRFHLHVFYIRRACCEQKGSSRWLMSLCRRLRFWSVGNVQSCFKVDLGASWCWMSSFVWNGLNRHAVEGFCRMGVGNLQPRAFDIILNLLCNSETKSDNECGLAIPFFSPVANSWAEAIEYCVVSCLGLWDEVMPEPE